MTEDLQYRLYNHTITPPGEAWLNIALELQKDAEQKLSLRLQGVAIEPPAGIWENIAGALEQTDEPSTTPVVPLKKRSWTRIAVAAVAAGIIVLAGLSYILWNEPASTTADKTTKAPRPSITNTQPQREDIHVKVAQPRASLSFAGVGSPISIPTRKRVTADSRIRYAKVDAAQAGIGENDVNIDELADQPASAHPNAFIGPQQYLTVTAPNGQPVKISSKFSNGLSYLFNNEPVFSIDGALKSISWKQQFSNWSNKLINRTGFIPAASNFFDIVELEELLKEQ